MLKRSLRQIRELNYFLIGQPGCGKSTLGSSLAQKWKNHIFIDADRDILEPSFRTSVSDAVNLYGNAFLEEEYKRTKEYLGQSALYSVYYLIILFRRKCE